MERQPHNEVFSLVHDDPWFHLQERLGMVPKNGKDGVIRRTVIFCLLAWLPLVVWALVTGRAFDNSTGEPLLQHYSIHVRFLLALPALIFGERVARSTLKRLLPRFVDMGLISEEKVPAFGKVIADLLRLRNATLPWVGIAGAIVAAAFVPDTGIHLEELNWAKDGQGLGFGGWWFLLVSRPIYQLFLFSWLWRVVLLFIFYRRIAKLGLDLLPAHPDRLGGLGFIATTPRGFSPFAFALSCVTASKWAHDIAWHGAHVNDLKVHGAIFVVMIVALCLFPLVVFFPLLKKAKRKGVAEYGALVARYDRMVAQRWIRGEETGEQPLLSAPELGPSCDIHSLYDSVRGMRMLPVDKTSLLPLLIPLALPLIAACAIEIPLAELVGKVFKTLL
ncbi:hypothetical protein [Luteolibacter soli]|uniref:Uncharacterized protein n=1 Tax=Luteolibacter soli TaxID=3135280 RepID=A0ABU9AT41_9BACT